MVLFSNITDYYQAQASETFDHNVKKKEQFAEIIIYSPEKLNVWFISQKSDSVRTSACYPAHDVKLMRS